MLSSKKKKMLCSKVIEAWQETRSLPIGHTDRKNAELAIKETYKRCHKIEYFWGQRLPRKKFSIQEALNLCNQICYLIGSPSLKGIFVGEVPVGSFACYMYTSKTITFCYDCIYIETLIHELSHHIYNSGGHGKGFCQTEIILFLIVYEIIKGKKPKENWEEKCLKMLE